MSTDPFAILDFMPVGVCILDRNYTVRGWNACLESWTGLPRSEVVGTNLLERYPHLDKPMYRSRFDVVFDGGPPAIFSAHLHKFLIPSHLPNGQTRLQHSVAGAYKQANGQGGVLAVITMQDVTETYGRLREYSSMRDQALREVEERRRAEERLRELATTDDLTKLSNRRHFMDTAGRELERARRFQHEASLLMLDVDHFKLINDTYGHAQGDEVLRTLSHIFRAALREVDLMGRMGGEEFAALLPETGRKGALAAAERIRSRVEDALIPNPRGLIRLTMSIGAATFDPDRHTLDSLLRDADQALYAAKQNGRNRTEIAG